MDANYIIYGKMGDMKRFKPVNGSRFVTNKIHAEVFTTRTKEDMQRLKREVAYMQTQGTFELRKVGNA